MPIFKKCGSFYSLFLTVASVSLSFYHLVSTNDTSTSEKPKPYVASAIYLTKLAEAEQIVYKKAQEYASSLKRRLVLVENYISDFEESTRTSKARGSTSQKLKPNNGGSDKNKGPNNNEAKKVQEMASNPIMAYRMVHRFTTDFQLLRSGMVDEIYLDGSILDEFDELEYSLGGLPTKKDKPDIIGALLRIQHFYNLKSDDLIKGKVMDIQTNVGLKANHSFEIAEFATDKDFYYLAYDWLQTVKIQIKKPKKKVASSALKQGEDIDIVKVMNAEKRLIHKHDKSFKKNLKNMQPYMFNNKMSVNSKSKTLKEITQEKYKNNRTHGSKHLYEYNFMALCNGDDYVTTKEKSELYCWLEKEVNPYFRINPLKMELLSKEPYLVQIYNFISDAWINEIKAAGIPQLERAPELYRFAMFAWLTDEEYINSPLPRKSELLLGLKVRGRKASDFLQVASYGIGGHVGIHFDYQGVSPFSTSHPDAHLRNPTFKAIGERMATFLFYLNDVESGGHTAFPMIGTSVKPIKGSAIFWYTALANGKVDIRALHGACPVVYGEKMIGTKWIHQNENFFRRPCALDPNL